MSTPQTPLKPVDLTNINNMLAKLNEFAIHVSNAKSVGVDTEDFERQHQYYTQMYHQLKSTYFPGK